MEKLKELQQRFFKASWEIKENKDGMSDELFREMNAHLLTEYMREYNKLNGTTGLAADIEIAELNRKRKKQEAEFAVLDKTLSEEIAMKRDATVPAHRRRWLFWHKPNRAMELAIESAQAQICEYLTAREDEVELQAIRVGAVPAEIGERVYGILSEMLPIPYSKKKQRRRENLIQELSQTLCKSITLNITNALTTEEQSNDTKEKTEMKNGEDEQATQESESGETDQSGKDTPDPDGADTL